MVSAPGLPVLRPPTRELLLAFRCRFAPRRPSELGASLRLLTRLTRLELGCPGADLGFVPEALPRLTQLRHLRLQVGPLEYQVLVPEFVYLRDNFGSRMNTIFKFYYQAWVMLSIGAAYGIYSVLAGAKLPSLSVRASFAALATVVTIVGLLYAILGIQTRMYYQDYANPRTLDGGGTVSNMDDYVASLCLGNLVTGTDAVIVSAVGGSYNWPSGAISTYTGIPTLLNWPGHESQWRGSTYGASAGSREGDVQRLYSDPTWSGTQEVIAKYGIDYIVFGAKERSVYASAEETKFFDNLEIACESGTTRIYHVPEQVVVQAVGQ